MTLREFWRDFGSPTILPASCNYRGMISRIVTIHPRKNKSPRCLLPVCFGRKREKKNSGDGTNVTSGLSTSGEPKPQNELSSDLDSHHRLRDGFGRGLKSESNPGKNKMPNPCLEECVQQRSSLLPLVSRRNRFKVAFLE